MDSFGQTNPVAGFTNILSRISETGEKFNNFVREEKLNSVISEKTKAVFISSKVPKTILDKRIKFD